MKALAYGRVPGGGVFYGRGTPVKALVNGRVLGWGVFYGRSTHPLSPAVAMPTINSCLAATAHSAPLSTDIFIVHTDLELSWGPPALPSLAVYRLFLQEEQDVGDLHRFFCVPLTTGTHQALLCSTDQSCADSERLNRHSRFPSSGLLLRRGATADWSPQARR